MWWWGVIKSGRGGLTCELANGMADRETRPEPDTLGWWSRKPWVLERWGDGAVEQWGGGAVR